MESGLVLRLGNANLVKLKKRVLSAGNGKSVPFSPQLLGLGWVASVIILRSRPLEILRDTEFRARL